MTDRAESVKRLLTSKFAAAVHAATNGSGQFSPFELRLAAETQRDFYLALDDALENAEPAAAGERYHLSHYFEHVALVNESGRSVATFMAIDIAQREADAEQVLALLAAPPSPAAQQAPSERKRTMRAPPIEWLMKHSGGDEGENITAGSPTIAYSAGDPCPECGKPMLYDKGESLSRDHPGERPAVFCTDCGIDYPVKEAAQQAAPAAPEVRDALAYAKIAHKLWMLLDDIDTLDDACKSSDKCYRDSASLLVEKRWGLLNAEQIDAIAAAPEVQK